MVEFNTVEGYIGVYPEHIPLASVLATGILTIHLEDGTTKQAALHEGFAKITQNKVMILAEVTEWPEEIDINRLAEKFFISKFYMMRLFQKETGTTVYTYLTQKRLLKARELMNGGMRATESCYACGFRSYSSFTRAYGKYFGTTPTGRADIHLIRAEVAE